MRRHARSHAQTFAIAAFAMTAMLGALSMVIDAGVYFVLQRQMQTAADAAALAAVWYDPACPSSQWGGAGCQANNPDPEAPECAVPPNVSFNWKPCTAAVEIVKANWGVAQSLCAGPNLPTGVNPVRITAYPGLPPSGSLVTPSVVPYVVSVSCDAPHWFARVLPGVSLTMSIQASAAAALGWLGPNGQIVGGATGTPPLVARLVI